MGVNESGQRGVIPLEDLISGVLLYNPKADIKILTKAYHFAEKVHAGQMRHSGDPYFSHPVAAAEILIQQRMDIPSICTALLHDVIEDTDITREQLEKEFGQEIAFLVEGVTNLSKVKLQSDKVHQAENFRKFIMAVSEDLRVLVIKLADRLHNMQTLSFHPRPKSRARKAFEVLEVYAPLAERIGMNNIKDSLEDTAFATLYPDDYKQIQSELSDLRKNGKSEISSMIKILKKIMKDNNLDMEIYGREKSPYSIWRKMRLKNLTFDEVFDITAFRFIVQNIDQCYRALGIIHSAYRMMPGRFKDYISSPKPNGYQSLHTTIIGPDDHRIEIQIRTEAMHRVAEFGIAAHWQYKTGEKLSAGDIRWLKNILEGIASAETTDEFLEHTKISDFKDSVFVFSPNGDVYSLPYGSTALDFAYEIHSELGHKCVGAKINRRIVNIYTPLNTGDQVDILTSSTQKPRMEWLNYVKTTKAKSYIRRFLRLARRDKMIELGKQLVDISFSNAGVTFSEKEATPILKDFQAKTVEDLYVFIGEGDYTTDSVLYALHPDKRPDQKRKGQTLISKLAEKDTPSQKVQTKGLFSDISLKFAKCCHPLPGDSIVGIIHTGSGITVHRHDCTSLDKFQDSPSRWVDLDWKQVNLSKEHFVGRLNIMTNYTHGALNSVTNVIAIHKAQILDIKVLMRTTQFIEFLIDLEVKDRAHLDELIMHLRNTSLVRSVVRNKS